VLTPRAAEDPQEGYQLTLDLPAVVEPTGMERLEIATKLD